MQNRVTRTIDAIIARTRNNVVKRNIDIGHTRNMRNVRLSHSFGLDIFAREPEDILDPGRDDFRGLYVL